VYGLMIVLVVAGLALLVGAPFIARLVVGGRGDRVGLTRIIQVVAVVLLVAALFLRPHSDETAAFPPPPDTPARDAR
jgi:hypothetical protein